MSKIKPTTEKVSQHAIPVTLKPSNSAEFPIIYADNQWDIAAPESALAAKMADTNSQQQGTQGDNGVGQYSQHDINERLAEGASAGSTAIQQIEIGQSEDIDQVGTPSVTRSNETDSSTGKPKTVLTFHQLKGEQGQSGQNGQDGQDGASAYQIWQQNGHQGESEQAFLDSLHGQNGTNGQDGASAYQIWQQNGHQGESEQAFLDSLRGQNGTNGQDGASAYDIWRQNGHQNGTEQEFLQSLIGANGQNGQDGTNGQDGASAYQIWQQQGNSGTVQDFINSLKGQDGQNGTNGTNGTNGADGKDGATWHSGTALTHTSGTATATITGAKTGDFYLNTSTYNIYKLTATANTWSYAGNIKGENGTSGTDASAGRWFFGTDITVNTDTIGATALGGNLVGTYNGRYPYNPKVGDMYLNVDSGKVFVCFFVTMSSDTTFPYANSSSWKYIGSVKNAPLEINGIVDDSESPMEISGISVDMKSTGSGTPKNTAGRKMKGATIHITGAGYSTVVGLEVSVDVGYAAILSGAVKTGTLTSTGNITAVGLYQTSDDRLKKYLDDFIFDIDRLADIPLKRFVYKDGDGHTNIGTSAQAVEKVLPEIVSEGEGGYKTVDYSKLSIVALSCIEQLRNIIANQQREIERLKQVVNI